MKCCSSPKKERNGIVALFFVIVQMYPKIVRAFYILAIIPYICH